MRKLTVSLLIAAVLLASGFVLIQIVKGQSVVVTRETDGDNVREVLAPSEGDNALAPSVSLIDSPTPYCYQPNPARDECFINWASMQVSGAPANMDTMTVTLDAFGPVAVYQGFFQEAMTVTFAMNGSGFQVPCGAPGVDGNANLGHAYGWTIRAEDTDGSTSSAFGTTHCPPYNP